MSTHRPCTAPRWGGKQGWVRAGPLALISKHGGAVASRRNALVQPLAAEQAPCTAASMASAACTCMPKLQVHAYCVSTVSSLPTSPCPLQLAPIPTLPARLQTRPSNQPTAGCHGKATHDDCPPCMHATQPKGRLHCTSPRQGVTRHPSVLPNRSQTTLTLGRGMQSRSRPPCGWSRHQSAASCAGRWEAQQRWGSRVSRSAECPAGADTAVSSKCPLPAPKLVGWQWQHATGWKPAHPLPLQLQRYSVLGLDVSMRPVQLVHAGQPPNQVGQGGKQG